MESRRIPAVSEVPQVCICYDLWHEVNKHTFCGGVHSHTIFLVARSTSIARENWKLSRSRNAPLSNIYISLA